MRKFLNNKLAIVGAGIFIVILLASILAPLLTSYDPLKAEMGSVLQAPSLEHIFGTDKVGRDVFARVLYGGRISILIGLGSSLGCAIIGVLLGCYGGYKGGWFDKIVLHISSFYVIPTISSCIITCNNTWTKFNKLNCNIYFNWMG